MLKIAFKLAAENPVNQDSADKFFEHFLRIARAMTGDYRRGVSLWNENDGFFIRRRPKPFASAATLTTGHFSRRPSKVSFTV